MYCRIGKTPGPSMFEANEMTNTLRKLAKEVNRVRYFNYVYITKRWKMP